MKTANVTISGANFELPEPYAEGHTCTAAEAQALNQTWRENIANNMRSKLEKLRAEVEAGDREPFDEAGFVQAYAAEYEFAGRRVAAASLSPEQKEALSVAHEQLTLAIKSQLNMTVKAFKEERGEDTYEAKLAELMENPDIVKEAKRRLKQKSEAAEGKIDLSAA